MAKGLDLWPAVARDNLVEDSLNASVKTGVCSVRCVLAMILAAGMDSDFN